MSSLLLIGFLHLSAGNRAPSPKPNGSGNTWFCHYKTAIQCESGELLPAEIRMYSPLHEVPHPDDTVAFVIARTSHSPGQAVLLDGLLIVPVPGNPSDESYQAGVPNILHPIFLALGSVGDKHQALGNGSRQFSVTCSEFVRDDRKASTVGCIFEKGFRWDKTPMPAVNSGVLALGTSLQLADSGAIALKLMHLTLNAGINTSSLAQAAPPPAGSPPAKRSRFAAWNSVGSAPASSSIASTSASASLGRSVLSHAATVASTARPAQSPPNVSTNSVAQHSLATLQAPGELSALPTSTATPALALPVCMPSSAISPGALPASGTLPASSDDDLYASEFEGLSASAMAVDDVGTASAAVPPSGKAKGKRPLRK